jgi:hypothetical protein
MINHGFWILKHDKPWILDGSIRFYTKMLGSSGLWLLDGQNHRTLGISIRQRPTRSRDPIRASVRPAISERSLISFLHFWCAVWVRYVSFHSTFWHILTHVQMVESPWTKILEFPPWKKDTFHQCKWTYQCILTSVSWYLPCYTVLLRRDNTEDHLGGASARRASSQNNNEKH